MILMSEFRLSQLAKPSAKVTRSPYVSVEDFDLPVNFCIHYVTDSPNVIGMRGSNPLIRNWLKNGSIGSYHVTELYKTLHKARMKTISRAALNSYYQSQSSFTKVLKLERVLARERQLLVMDYSPLSVSLVVNQSLMQFYYTFENIATTMLENMKTQTHNRNNIIQIHFPEVLPEKTEFNKADESELSSDEATIWTDFNQFWLRELWLLIQDKGHIKKALVKSSRKGEADFYTNLFVSINVGTSIVTIDINKLYLDGRENENETKTNFYKLLQDIYHKTTGADTEALENVEEATESEIASTEEALLELTREKLRTGRMSESEQARIIKLANNSKNIPSQYGTPLGELSVTKPEDYTIDSSSNVQINDKIATKEEAKSTVSGFHKSYINNVLDKHIAAVALSFNDSGYILKDYAVEEFQDALNNRRIIKLKMMPIEGKETTFELPVPVINEDGTYIHDGVQYSTDVQRVDAPIRKTAANRVALTSYYGKIFFLRSEKVVDDWSKWLITNIQAMSLDSSNRKITGLKRDKRPRVKDDIPRAYVALTETITSFKSSGIEFNFNYPEMDENFGKGANKKALSKGMFPVGKRDESIIYMDKSNTLYENNKSIGRFVDVIGIDKKEPIDKAMVKVYGKELPMGIMLASYIGWRKLVKWCDAEVFEFPANTNDRLPAESYIELLFKDKRVFIKKDNPVASLVFSGFQVLRDNLRSYKVSDLENKSNFMPLILDMGLSPIMVRELDIMKKYFIDPITKDALENMEEPTKWMPLLKRVLELLTTDQYPNETDPTHQRLRGYERIPGFLYTNMVAAIRKHENSSTKASSKLEMSNYVLQKGLVEDTSTQLVQDSNPLHKLKQQEAITLSGTGGRSARTLVMRSRIYDDNDVGIISEATPDSAKVAIRTFATPNAKINSTLGFMGSFDKDKDNATSLLSTTSLFLPASHHDSPQRANLANVQASAIVPTKGSVSSPYSTGYDRIIGSRVGKKFAFVAQQDGEITKVGDRIIVKYKDGTNEGVKLGIWHGEVAGEYISHTMVSDLVVGKKVKKGHVLAWNDGFFERDFLNPTNVVAKYGALSYVALCEGNDTLEDGCAISEELANDMTTVQTKRKTIIVNFDQEIEILKDVGDTVEYDDIIVRITNYVEGLDQTEESIAALEKFSGSNPTTGKSGKITGAELIYMGDKSDMSPKLRELADRFDKQKAKDKRELGSNFGSTCEVKNSVFFGGERVTENTLAISFFIDKDTPMGIGDKKVFVNQLKSVVGRKMTGVNETESGRKLGARFGLRSVFARIVGSAFIIGGNNLCIKWGNDEFVRLAEGD